MRVVLGTGDGREDGKGATKVGRRLTGNGALSEIASNARATRGKGSEKILRAGPVCRFEDNSFSSTRRSVTGAVAGEAFVFNFNTSCVSRSLEDKTGRLGKDPTRRVSEGVLGMFSFPFCTYTPRRVR